jgi:hypothetical protein
MNKLTIQQARQTNLAAYLLQRGEKLIQTGSRYHHAEHDSLVITNNAFFWNSKGTGGNAVDFLMEYYGMTFNDAVRELTGYEKKEVLPPPSFPSQSFNFTAINLCSDMKRTVAYLTITRKIAADLIQKLIKDKYIFQENGTNNIIFAMYNENRQIVGAELCGTLSERKFKGIKENSTFGYGFNVGVPDANGRGYSYALFFESAIDLLSFIEISRLNNKPLTACLLVSLGGLKENIIKHTLNAFKCPSRSLQCVICVDNDIAGVNLTKTLETQNIAFKTHFPQQDFKDWNEQLKKMKG